MEETKIKETVNKRVIVGSIQNYTGAVSGKRWNKEDSTIAYDSFMASLKGLILTYGKVVLPGIGTFEIKIRKGKKVPNNLRLGEEGQEWFYSKDKQFLSFTASEVLDETIKNLNYTFISDPDAECEENGGEE